MQNIATNEILAIRVIKGLDITYGFNLSDCYIKWATSEIMRGQQSISLYTLASMSLFDNPFQIEDYFYRSLKELNINLPEQQKILENYATLVCEKILNNELTPHQGCLLINKLCIHSDYRDYYDWYELQNDFEAGLISEDDFIKMVEQKSIVCSSNKK